MWRMAPGALARPISIRITSVGPDVILMDTGLADIHQDHVGPDRDRALDRLVGVVGIVDHGAAELFQNRRNRPGDQNVVLDQQDARAPHPWQPLMAFVRRPPRRAKSPYRQAARVSPVIKPIKVKNMSISNGIFEVTN